MERAGVANDLDLARQGDANALDRLAAAYRAPVVNYIRRRGFNAADAEDLAQEVFVKIVEQDMLKRYLPAVGRFRGLLIGVARNVIREHLRRRSALKRGGPGPVTQRILLEIGDDTSVPGSDEAFDQSWVVLLLQRAFKRLENSSKELQNEQDAIVRLNVFEGASYTDIAKQLGLEPGVVRNLLYRGRQKLIEYVRDEVAAYTAPGVEFEAELAHILRLIGAP
jgi:RNA polymerase sigma-70 factor (ECF subfamily)